MIILRQREFGNKANKEAQREWKKKNRHSTIEDDVKFYQNQPLQEENDLVSSHKVPSHIRGAGFVNTNKKDQYRTKGVGNIQKHVNKVRGEADKIAIESGESIYGNFLSDDKSTRKKSLKVSNKLDRLNSLEKAKKRITGELTPEEKKLWNKDVRSVSLP